MDDTEESLDAFQARTQALIERTQAVIDEGRRQLEAGRETLRSLGMDSEEFRAALEAQLTPEIRAAAEQALAEQMAAIDQEVAEELARAAFATPAKRTGNPRPRRNMV